MEFHDPDIERGSTAGVPARSGSGAEPAGTDAGLTASEWRRAGIAIAGVTLVLSIAAGIHFVAPTQHDNGARPAVRMARVSDPVRRTDSSVSAHTSELSEQAVAESMPRPPEPHRVRASSHQTAARESATPEVDAAPAVMPRVAMIEYPEAAVQFETMRLSVSETFGETPLPATLAEGEGDLDVPPARGTRRDPVTAAFVTAGSAVAGGFRSAGRAMKRVF